MRCEGYRRHGGFFTLGPVNWEQCQNDAIVYLSLIQDGEEEKTYPACIKCWDECASAGTTITKVVPIPQQDIA